MTLSRSLKWIAGVFLASVALAITLATLYVALFGWNALRGPIERMTLEKTGRELVIGGELTVELTWPFPGVQADTVSFANPAWAKEEKMIAVDAIDIQIDLMQLIRGNIVLPEVRLTRPVIFLERGTEGRRNWLLDRTQQDVGAHLRIGRLMLDEGTVGYDDSAQKTRIRAQLSTSDPEPGKAGLTFTAQGQFKGMPLKTRGQGGPVLGLRDESTPYPIKGDLTIGNTVVKAEGSITGLTSLSAVDLRLGVSGPSLAQLYPLLGIVLPETHAYETEGHLVHDERTWRYEKFTGRIGNSDIAGTAQLVTGEGRPALQADLVSRMLDIADLGPPVGIDPARAKPASSRTAAAAPLAKVLPELPFVIERWNSVDAEVMLQAKTIRHPAGMPLDDLVTRLSLRNSVLTLDPLQLGVAGGQLNGTISLDGREHPIKAHASMRAQKMRLAKLFPTVELNKSSIGQINGEFDLTGRGDSVRDMLASSNGKLGLVVAGGEISKLMMKQVGLHLWDIVQLTVTGDELVKVRCAVADFDIEDGIMETRALVFDTAVTTIIGTGRIDLKQETFDLTLGQVTKETSAVALSSPLYVRGSFAQPDVEFDKGRVIGRALGAVALGAINPLLALIPLIDAGPGEDRDCAQLLRDARKSSQSAKPR
ncbi:MAG: AsmA family protein [Azoarcus sp.]|nr:AsmA family protein [Azoarcus sp.]